METSRSSFTIHFSAQLAEAWTLALARDWLAIVQAITDPDTPLATGLPGWALAGRDSHPLDGIRRSRGRTLTDRISGLQVVRDPVLPVLQAAPR